MTKKQKKVLWRIIATAVLVAVVKLFSIGGVAGTVLYLAAYLIIGYDILRKAFWGIIKGQVFDENFLMAVATVGAIALAVYEKSGDYLEAVAVMLFYQIGELFQSYAVGKSRRSITARIMPTLSRTASWCRWTRMTWLWAASSWCSPARRSRWTA